MERFTAMLYSSMWSLAEGWLNFCSSSHWSEAPGLSTSNSPFLFPTGNALPLPHCLVAFSGSSPTQITFRPDFPAICASLVFLRNLGHHGLTCYFSCQLVRTETCCKLGCNIARGLCALIGGARWSWHNPFDRVGKSHLVFGRSRGKPATWYFSAGESSHKGTLPGCAQTSYLIIENHWESRKKRGCFWSQVCLFMSFSKQKRPDCPKGWGKGNLLCNSSDL